MNEIVFDFLPPKEAERPYTVSEINAGISLILESFNTLVWVEGEISNWRMSGNGHCYFRLKDSESQIPAVIWRSAAERLPFDPEDGISVLVIGSIKVYRKAGYYQLDIHRMEPLGRGALFLAFERLKKRLEKEGLFDPAHTVPLPASVRRIGVVTSRQGAAIHDIIRVVRSRSPQIDIVIADVPVQGEQAAPLIAQAIADFNRWGGVDCIIVGRGGGSMEDLQPFNEEIVARAIYASELPVVSAVGHEIDYTIADFAADMRAPTPSAAAERVTPDSAENRKYFDACAGRFSRAAAHCFGGMNDRFQSIASSRALKMPLQQLLESQQELDDCLHAFQRCMARQLQSTTQKLSTAAARFNSASPLNILARGYSVVTKENGAAVRDAAELSPGQTVSMRFFKGRATGTVNTVKSEE